MKTTLDDYINAVAIRLTWLRTMNECRRRNNMIGFMYAQFNVLYWGDETSRLVDKHIGELTELLQLAHGDKV